MKPTQLKALQSKSKRLLVRVIRLTEEGDTFFVVVGSRSAATLNRVVTVQFKPDDTIIARCTCPWAEHGGVACSHVIAALSKLAARKRRALRFWATPEEAQRQKHSVFQLVGPRPDENIWITSRAAA
jgi:uncharacterized Zn finger protein